MFSYDTIERETYVKNKKDGDTTFKAFWSEPAEGGTEYTENNPDYIPLVESLTKNSINPNMNYLYQEEVEYILYGENGKTKVKKIVTLEIVISKKSINAANILFDFFANNICFINIL